jgi:hypothetical protein
MHEVIDILQQLTTDPSNESLWYKLYEPIYHQGLVSPLSYATTIKLAEFARTVTPRPKQLYGLAEAIEVARLDRYSPELPEIMKADYIAAMATLVELASNDIARATEQYHVIGLLSFLAAAKNQHFVAERIIAGESLEVSEKMWDETHDKSKCLDFSHKSQEP